MTAARATTTPTPRAHEPGIRPGIDWAPNSDAQVRFLASTAHEVLFGGAAGGGKSMSAVMLPLRWCGASFFKALILRRKTPHLEELLGYARRFYPLVYPGARPKWHGSHLVWHFPSGAEVRFAHCNQESDAFVFQGHEYPLVIFDELTHFSAGQYQEIKSRVRTSVAELPKYVRATSNPGGSGHEWVFRRWGAWLDPNFETPGGPVEIPNLADPRQTLTIPTVKLAPRIDAATQKKLPPLRPNTCAWVVPDAAGKEHFVRRATPLALSRAFLPAFLTDNKDLMATDQAYLRRLMDLDPLRRAQLLAGDWTAKAQAGLLFRREWFKWASVAPAKAVRIRYWDRAATEPTPQTDPDYTVGVKVAKTFEGEFYLEDVVRHRGTPGEIERLVKSTAIADGQRVHVGLEQDPGQAGKFEVERYVKVLQGFAVHAFPAQRNKVTRAQPASAQVEHGNVWILQRPWARGSLEAFLMELEGFPDEGHDDQVDAFSGAINALSLMNTVKYDGDYDAYLPSSKHS